jgi:3-oxoacyl-[acyl-carrier protein] reductase
VSVVGVERTALVTGAAQGLGEAIAASLHAAGCRVMLAGRDLEHTARAASGIDPDGERAAATKVDVLERDSIEAAIAATEERFGALEVLVNNAARSVIRPLWEVEADEWDEVLATNLRGVLFGIQAAGPGMRERGFGRIINHASIAGQQGGLVMGAHYAAAKAGMLVLTKIAAQELASSGVTVNAIAPAAIYGPFMQALGEEKIEALAKQIPVGRVGRPEEVGALVAYLASDDSGYMTGATVDLNGGIFMR